MVDEELALMYYGQPPYYRHILSGRIQKLPFSVRMPDGSLRTDPKQWSQDPYVMSIAGYELSNITEQDIEYALPKLPEEKEKSISQLNINWKNYIENNGFRTEEGWYLGIDTSDVSLLTGAFLLLKESVSMGLENSTSIVDMHGNSHVVDLHAMTNIMLQYGQFRSQKSKEYADKYQSIINSQSIEELNNLDISIGG